QLQRQVLELQDRLENGAACGALLGTSRPMQTLFGQIARAARVSLPVLIRGESGTGKELVARELHERSGRANKAFIAVNTAAIAESLVESELFGHVKGAFTGAERAREGVFRQADGGTLFLDEIGDMPLNVQTRLLRVLQEGIVQPVGTEETIAVDVRVISATHQDLEQAISEKLFRQDLYFRLRGIELNIVPLRSRREDILPLAIEFLGPGFTLSSDAASALVNHLWPGNVRELKQCVLSAAAMAETDCITARDLGLSGQVQDAAPCAPAGFFDDYFDLPLTEARDLLTTNFERAAIVRALELEAGNISAAARRLNVHRQSLQQKIKQLGLSVDRDTGE
ncbi:MAG: sigma-54-dependent Fis family transcriptional regulator, partial [Pirellulaceae bacterium]|nr:sigma-54-dependent Fis family transcriptional regulator [Pirellulaceae bacterium]